MHRSIFSVKDEGAAMLSISTLIARGRPWLNEAPGFDEVKLKRFVINTCFPSSPNVDIIQYIKSVGD